MVFPAATSAADANCAPNRTAVAKAVRKTRPKLLLFMMLSFTVLYESVGKNVKVVTRYVNSPNGLTAVCEGSLLVTFVTVKKEMALARAIS
jgi:hypothetical protein